MMELTGKIAGGSWSMEGRLLITLEVNEAQAGAEALDKYREVDKLSIKLGKFREKRSLDANAYFHVLCSEIAARQNLGNEEVKKRLVSEYGTIARDDDGNVVGAMVPEGTDMDAFYPYNRMYKTMEMDGRVYECYLFYKRSHELNTKEFSRLIDGAVYEAKNLGIETMAPEELRSLIDRREADGK